MKQFSCRLFWLLALLALSPILLFAQSGQTATLEGRVVSSETGEPLQDANVFIAVSTQGTVAGPDGRYRLEGVPLGAHRLYVSMLGYEAQATDIVLRQGGSHTYDFSLKPTVIQGEEVVLEGEHDRRWRRRLEKFTDLFIGETPNADQSTIINPEVLDFEERLGRFTARASEPLTIENQALGYRVTYFLKEFVAEGGRTQYDGEPLYEELQPESPDQAVIWEGNRREAYYGSFRHFILAAFDGTWEDQGFVLYHRPSAQSGMSQGVFSNLPGAQRGMQSGPRFPIKPEEFIKDGPTALEKELGFPGFVEIVFTGEMEDSKYLNWGNRAVGAQPKYQTSWIQVEKGPTMVDYKGDPLDPYGITFYGYLAFERVADEVPKEYRPSGN
jgi:hypothetical protein